MNQPIVFPQALLHRIGATRVMAVVIVDDPGDAVPLAEALLAGGVDAMELTLRTAGAVDAIAQIKSRVPTMIVGAGTTLSREQLSRVIDAGADFAVAPGTNPRVLTSAAERGFAFAPGVATPTDIETALEFGCRLLKFFPAEPIGGLIYLKAVAAPFAHLGMKYIPLGSIDLKRAADYWRQPMVLAVGGSWIAPREMIASRDFNGIEANARAAVAAASAIRV